jgi:Thioesterase domain
MLKATDLEVVMTRWRGFAAIGFLSLALMLVLGSREAMAQPRAHVYLFRGLADVFSLGMDTLAGELNKRGIDASSHSHSDWKSIADKAAANYKAGKEGPIILVGHSLGADAVMEMADYLGEKGVPVALVVPFDATQSFPAPGNVARVLNLTQRDYAHMRPGPGFRGSLRNIDLSGDPKIDHLNIDKSPRLHALVISEIVAIVGGHPASPSVVVKPAPTGPVTVNRPDSNGVAPAGSGASGTSVRPPAASATSKHETGEMPANFAAPATPSQSPKPAASPHSIDPAQIPN